MKNIREDLISVIVPVYNVEKYLRRCLDTIINQTYKNIEILLVNDGSKDNSYNILLEYASKDDRIIVFNKENGGLSDARNYGLDRCNGKYVIFIDSDDYIDQNMIEGLYEAILETNSEISVCDIMYVYDDGTNAYSNGGNFTLTNSKEDPSIVRINNSASNKLFLTSLFDGLRFPLNKYYEDLGTIPITFYKAKNICKVDKPYYFYYQRKGSIAHVASTKIFDIYYCINRCYENIDDERVRDEIKKLYIVHGLDICTIKIKDFDDKKIRKDYLKMNMEYLSRYYSDYRKDEILKQYNLKKRLIFKLLDFGLYDLVLKIYDR